MKHQAPRKRPRKGHQKPVLTPESAKAALRGDFENLLRQVKSGKPLSEHQRRTIERELRGADAAPDGGAAFARNQTQLAAALGVSRQLIAYHAKRPGSPGHRPDGRYEVRAWREYLAVNGRVDVSESAPHPGQGNASFSDLADFGAMRGLERAAGVLPLVLGEGLAGKLPAREIAGLVAQTWAALATRLTAFLSSDGPRSVPMETPPQILAMCALAGVACPVGIDIGLDDATEPG